MKGRILLLTATPVKSHIADLSLVRAVWPDRLAMTKMDLLLNNPNDFDDMYRNPNDGRYSIQKITHVIAPYIIYRKSNVDVPDIDSPKFIYAKMNYAESVNEWDWGCKFTTRIKVDLQAELTMSKIRIIANLVQRSTRPIVVYSEFINLMRERGMDPTTEQYKLLSPFNTKYMSMNLGEEEIQTTLSLFNADINKSGVSIKLLFFGRGMSEGIKFHMADMLIFLSPTEKLHKFIQRIGHVFSPQTLNDLSGTSRKIKILVMCSVYNHKFMTEIERPINTEEQKRKVIVNELQKTADIVDLILGSSLNIIKDNEPELPRTLNEDIVKGGGRNNDFYIDGGYASLIDLLG